jgi:WS/DGAT/MGAT family acyltransferase
MEIGHVLLSPDPDTPPPRPTPWRPERLPTAAELLRGALEEYTRRPTAVLERAVGAATDLRSTAARWTSTAGGLLRAARSTLFPAPSTPLNTAVGPQRRVAVARLSLADVKQVRKGNGGTVHDVLLAVVAGALREWLLSRGEPVVAATAVRALVPVSVQGEGEQAPGNRVAPYLLELPVGEPNPRLRLARVRYAMRGVAQHGERVGADSLIAATGFAPPTLHVLGARAARGLSGRLFNLMVTNVPGPQVPLHAAGGRLLEVFSVVPLARGHALSIGMTSYDGRVFVALNADRDSVGDVDVLADLVEQEIDDLVQMVG